MVWRCKKKKREREREIERLGEWEAPRLAAYLSHDIYLFVVHQLQQGGGCIGVAAGEGESKEHDPQKKELHVFSFLPFSFPSFLSCNGAVC